MYIHILILPPIIHDKGGGISHIHLNQIWKRKMFSFQHLVGQSGAGAVLKP